MSALPIIPEEKKIDFKFKKPGFDKLLIFDLDETLIHTKVMDEDQNDGDDVYAYQADIKPDFCIEIMDPYTNQPFLNEFFVRPHVK